MRTDDLKAFTIYVKFDIGDIVYLKHRKEKFKGLVCGYNYRPQGVHYLISWADGSGDQHWDIELTKEYIPDYSDNADED